MRPSNGCWLCAKGLLLCGSRNGLLDETDCISRPTATPRPVGEKREGPTANGVFSLPSIHQWRHLQPRVETALVQDAFV